MSRKNSTNTSGPRGRATARAAIITALVASAASTTAALGESITVGNPGFESPALANCGFTVCDAWLEFGDGGAWRVGGTECPHEGYPSGVPQGLQVGYINNGTNKLQQTLAATLQANSVYQLTVEVGRRADCCQMISYTVRLFAGDLLIAEDPGMLDPEPGTFETSVICATVGASHAALGEPLRIELAINGGSQANFDDVRLERLPAGTPCSSAGIPGDINGDGSVDGGDLGLMLAAWGSCGACANCPADLNDDCVVDGSDLGLLLGNWG